VLHNLLDKQKNRFIRSTESVSRRFEEVLECVYNLSADIIKVKDQLCAS
jgi:hypothetical protein